MQRLQELIGDAAALAVKPEITARLYYRLGWVCAALGERASSRHAFSEMLELARASGDDRLVRAAERGQRAAGRIAPGRNAQRDATAIFRVFHGGEAIDEPASMFGRDKELRRLSDLVASVGCRFLSVWGETGSGKTSLVLAGLIPKLAGSNEFLPVLTQRWDNPEAELRLALARKSVTGLDSQPPLSACLQAAAQQKGKTIVVVCDQFEQFFTAVTPRGRRVPLLEAIGACVNNIRLPCKFIFVIRQDRLGDLAEFDNYAQEPLETRKRFYVPFFSEPDAVAVLRQISVAAELGWSDRFLRAVAADLTEEGRVRPVKLQLVGTALALSGIDSEVDYARAGNGAGLQADHLDLVLTSLYHPLLLALPPSRILAGLVETTYEFTTSYLGYGIPRRVATYLERKIWLNAAKRVLLALVDEPNRRLTLSLSEIEHGRWLGEEKLRRMLDELIRAHLVRRVPGPPRPTSPDATPDEVQREDSRDRFELTHDYLVDLVLQATRQFQDRRRQANRVLHRALEDVVINPRHTVGLGHRLLVRNHADIRNLTEREKSQTRALLRRSLWWGVLRWFVLLPATAVLILTLIQGNSGQVTIERDFADRVVVRRGLPWLGFLPVLGNRIILDTGFVYGDLDREHVNEVNGLVHMQWDNRQSGVLNGKLIDVLRSKIERGKLLCQLGREVEGIDVLKGVQKANDPGARQEAVATLMKAAQSNPERVLDPLLAALKDEDIVVRGAAAGALGRLVQADPSLAGKVLDPLLVVLKDRDHPVHGAATKALGRLAQFASSSLRKKTFLLLSDFDATIRSTMRDPLSEALVALARRERDPARFLLDHLTGQRSELPDGDANTYAVYRDVAVGALARWMASERQDQPQIRSELEKLRRSNMLHLHMAAWNVRAEAAELREKQSLENTSEDW